MPQGPVTVLLERIRLGDDDAQRELFHLLFQRLKIDAERVARSDGWPWANNGGTRLVCDTYLHLVTGGRLDARSQKHFFYVFRRAVRQMLIDEARKARSKKRGGDRHHAPFIDHPVDAPVEHATLDAVRYAMEELRAIDPCSAQVIELRFYRGMSFARCAVTLGCTLATVRGHWDYGSAWLKTRLAAGK